MKSVLRFGALAVGVALTAGGAGEAAQPSRKPAQAAESRKGESRKGAARQETSKQEASSSEREPERQGPARIGPARMGPAAMDNAPRIADGQKDELADRKRDEAIEGFKRLIPKLQEGSHRRADMLYRLAELYWEKSKYLYQQEMNRYLAAEKAQDAATARGEKQEAPQADHSESERFRAETMGIYEILLRDYADWPQRDEILFYLGYNLQELGRRDEAVKRYLQLIEEFPQSQFVPDTYVQLGNHYFDNNKLKEAREYYEKARASKVPKVYAYAVYKLAWCDYNAGGYDEGLAKLHEVVDYAEARGEELGDLKTEALNDVIVFYVKLDKAKEGIAYFKQKAPQKRQERLISKMAAELMDVGLYDSAIETYRTLIRDNPKGPGAPDYQQSIVRSYEGLRQRTQVRAEMKRMVELYRPGSEWWQANADNKPVLRNAFSVTEEAMRVMVTDYHQEAQKTRQVETYRLARDIYKEYVDTFASSEDPEFISDSAFNMRFFYAEILWALEEWEAAAAQYDAVVAFKVPDRDSAREVSNESYRKSASFAAIMAYDKLVKIERGQLTKSDLKDGQKVDENKSKGHVEKKGRITKKDTDQAEEPLTRFEERLVAACDTYNRLFPDTPDEIDLRYQAALIVYDRHHYMDAARRFGEIINKFPSERRSRDAADLTMYVLESREEWLELNKLSRQFLANDKLLKPSPEFASRVARVVEGSQYKWIHEVVYQKEKNPAKAAELFLDYVKEFPRSENADRALTSAMVIFQEAGQIDRGVAAGERVLTDYADSAFEPKVRYTLARLYEKIAEFRKAAAMYAAFVDAQDAASRAVVARKAKPVAKKGKDSKEKESMSGDAPSADEARARKDEERRALLVESEKWVPDALFNAGLWWEGVGESDKAISAYRAYMARFKDRPDVPQLAYNLGLIYEKDGKSAEAARAFDSFAETYGRDSRTSAGQVYLARYRQLLAYRKLKNTRDTDRIQGELVRGWAKLSPQERQRPELLNAYGHARFLAVEPDWQRYVDVRFKRVATIRRDLASKQQSMQRLEKAYTDVLASGSGEWGIAALTRIGLAYADFARNIIESPDPAGLDEEQRSMYRGELENLALPLEDKASEALEKALGKAYELSLYNEWTLAAQEQVNRYHPGAYAQVRQVPFRGSEFFVTADVAKEPGLPDTSQAGATPAPAAPAPGSSTAPEAAPEPTPPAGGPVPVPSTASGKVQP
ncbi:tetratricopeptide repeat protein [Vitiosangium sp. GDMCC 1.1324]|uniref:tetratricopeptide repeat protein n=1 Tax=Vitiosangium sp. (strain GDMCC 1.1324) TaxID=2138576 RepID=UPI000D39E961|nr:tetratricopeptide repeat protein [Vitiosangium sp. GDMCC 1.1324]PTL85483.1 gliding motility protein U [Vitiosangium sp. GDMCC 1.1324]